MHIQSEHMYLFNTKGATGYCVEQGMVDTGSCMLEKAKASLIPGLNIFYST